MPRIIRPVEESSSISQKPNRTRNIKLTIQLSESENARLESLVKETGLSKNNLIVRLIMGPVQFSAFDRDKYQSALKELARQGNNLNQIAHALNSKVFSSARSPVAVISAAEAIEAMVQEVKRSNAALSLAVADTFYTESRYL